MNERLANYKKRLVSKKGRSILEDYSLIGEYVTMRTKVEFKHNKCGFTWKTSPDTFLRTKKGCPQCSGNKRVDTEEFKNKVFALEGEEYLVLGEYINARTPIEIRHEKCGYEWETTPYSFTGLGTRCPNCNGGVTLTQEQFEGRILKRYGLDYSIVGTYINNRTPIKVTHSKCGMTWEPYPDNLLRGHGCPQCCYRSKGELFISKYLDSLGVHYEREYTFKDLFYKNERYPLRMDFYLEKENTIVEYDGIQHFQPVELFGGEKAFKETQVKDALKNSYASEKGINMVRIPYFYSKEEVVREIDKILVNK